jgi:hypothetical protein
MKALWVAALSAIALIAARSAAAQDPPRDAATIAARRDLLDQATHASESGDHRHALDLAQRAMQLQASASLRMFIAQEQLSLELFVESMGTAEQCVREAERDPALHNRDVILPTCREVMTTSSSRISHLTVHFEGAVPPDARVTVNGNALAAALFDTSYAVNPGQTVVDMTAPGYRAVHREVTIAPQGNEVVRLTVERDPNATVASPVSRPAEGGNGGGIGGTPALVVAGVGALALIGSAVLFGVQTSMAGSYEQAHCVPPDHSICDNSPDSQSQLSSLHAVNTAMFVSLGIGGALLVGGGIAWFVTRPHAASHPSTEHVSLQFAPMPGGVMLGVGGAL